MITFFNDYFIDSNVIHDVGECIDEKAFVLPFRLAKDFDKTKCGLDLHGMDFLCSGTPIHKTDLTFCKNCRNHLK